MQQYQQQQNDLDMVEEFKLDIHIAKDNINSKIFQISIPLIACNLLGYIYQLLSYNVQQVHYSITSVSANIVFLPITSIICEKVPMAFAYSMSFDLITNRIQQNVEKCNQIIASYMQLSIAVSVVFGLIFGAMSTFLKDKILLPESYGISFTIYLIFGYLLNSLNGALFYRYLAEQRIFLILVRAAIQYLGQMGMEQFLYVVAGGVQGNLMTIIALIIINGLMIAWQFYIAMGRTAYGFKLRNIATIYFSQLVTFSKESMRFQGKILLNGLLKLIADITSPFCIFLSQLFVYQTFDEAEREYFAHNDLYIYGYVFSIIRAVPDAFVSVYALIGAVCVSYGDYALQQHANFRIILLCIVFSAIVALLVFFFKSFLAEMFYDFGNAEILKYFNDPTTNYNFVVIVSLVLYCLDIFYQTGIMSAIQANNIIELLAMPVLKFVVSITSITTIRSQIGNRANYMYSILFSEGCGDIIGIVYLLNMYVHYYLVLKKLQAKTSSSKESKKK